VSGCRCYCVGAFCGDVEIDSDIEQVLQDTAHTGAMVDTATRRKLLQRQFVMQMQSAFQLIKVRRVEDAVWCVVNERCPVRRSSCNSPLCFCL
jgi:hypothetical protein